MVDRKEPWFMRVIKEKKKEVLTSAFVLVGFSLTVAIWHFFIGKAFEWQDINPIEEPSLVPRLIYSALVYVTLGAYLYHRGFYKFLYEPYRGGGRRSYREYQKLKGAIWGLLILLMYFVIVPFAVYLLNATISFFYNLYVLVLYLAPPIAITGLLYCAYSVTWHYYKRWK